jgi:hypothetical protein
LSHDWTGQGGSLPWPPINIEEGRTKKGGGDVRLKEKFWGTKWVYLRKTKRLQGEKKRKKNREKKIERSLERAREKERKNRKDCFFTREQNRKKETREEKKIEKTGEDE